MLFGLFLLIFHHLFNYFELLFLLFHSLFFWGRNKTLIAVNGKKNTKIQTNKCYYVFFSFLRSFVFLNWGRIEEKRPRVGVGCNRQRTTRELLNMLWMSRGKLNEGIPWRIIGNICEMKFWWKTTWRTQSERNHQVSCMSSI